MGDDVDEMLEALAAAESAGAASPPRRPPTAVGTGEAGSGPPQWRDPRTLPGLIREIAGSLAMPIEHTAFDEETQAALHEADVRTVGDLLRLSDRRMRALGIDENTRRYVVSWRRAMGAPTTGR